MSRPPIPPEESIAEIDFASEIVVEPDPGWLRRALDASADGRFPEADHRVRLAPAVDGAAALVVAFSGHHVIASGLDPAEIAGHLRASETRLPTTPPVLTWLADRVRTRRPETIDVVVAARGGERTGALEIVEQPPHEHPRVEFSASTRRDLRVFGAADESALAILGHGVAGRLELAFETAPEARNAGTARAMICAVLGTVTEADVVFAQIAAGNAAALRAALAAGMRPVCAEYLLH